MKLMIAFLIAALPVTSVAQSPSVAALPRTTEVMVILTAKQGVTREQIMAIMPSEIRETVKLYLDGKIRQWYSRGDGKGVIFLIGESCRNLNRPNIYAQIPSPMIIQIIKTSSRVKIFP